MNTDKSIQITADGALGIAHRNIEILSRHRKELLEELYSVSFDATEDNGIGEMYASLDMAFLRAIHAEADRAIKFARSV